MIDILKLLTASEELLDDSDPICPPDDPEDRKVLLAKRLESEGLKPICIGRALVTIERSESDTELPESLRPNWGVMKISVYSDPDVSGHEEPEILYIECGRYGIDKIFYDNGNIAHEINKTS